VAGELAAATRARLLTAGRAVLAERGVDGFGVDAVVTRAGVAHGTFYGHFRDVDDLLGTLSVHTAGELSVLAASLGPVTTGPDATTDLRPWIAAFIVVARAEGGVLRAIVEGRVTDPSAAAAAGGAVAELVAAVAARIGEVRPADGDELARRAQALFAMLERSTYVVATRPLGFDDAEMLDTLTTLVHRGFFAEPPAPVVESAERELVDELAHDEAPADLIG